MAKRRSNISRDESQGLTPSEDSFDGWFKLACQLASNSQLVEAERAMIIALDLNAVHPKAWAILSAIYLSLGRETDAEKAGKKAIAHCLELKTTWPKLRSIILSNGIKKGADWKSPRRVLLNSDAISTWRDTLAILGKTIAEETEKTLQQEKTESTKENEHIEPEKDEIQTKQEPFKERAVLPLISSKKVEGLTKLEIEKLKPEIKEEARRIEETPTESKRQALPTFSSKKVVDVTEKYDEQKAAKETIVKDTPLVSRESESASSCFSSAAFHLSKGNWDEAEKAYVRGLALEPENSEAWIHLGSLLLKKNKFKEAENALRVATKHSSNNANAWYLLGVCLQKQENWNDALIVLRTAKNLNQTKADIWQALGESEFHMGQYQDAARSFLRTLRISPEHKDAMFYLALCMERRGNRQHALSLFIKLLNTGDLSASMLEKIAGAFERLNRPAEAREARRRAALARKIGS